MKSDGTEQRPRHIVIAGGGFGGIYAALRLEKLLKKRADVTVTLVTRDNYFLFTPMLHEVATGDIELHSIVNPLRKMLRRVNTFVGSVDSIDLAHRHLCVSHGFDSHRHELGYDHLILALGCATNFFGLPGVDDKALTLKSLGDAVELRNRLILHLEEANSECSAGERQPLLTFVVAGAGFAGVESTGGINDFIRESLRFYPLLNQAHMRTVLVSAGDSILPELGPKLGHYTHLKLAERGVEIITNTRVAAFKNGVVQLSNGTTIPARTLIWTAGTAPNPLIATLPLPKHEGRVEVNAYLEVPGWPGVWAVGDCALIPDARSRGFHPPTAQHAIREGRAVAENVAADLAGERKKPFHFSTLGQLATVGRRTGVANILGIHISGFIAWWLWRTIYLSKLPRLEKKVRVAVDWTLDLLFAKDLACVEASDSFRASRLSPAPGDGDAAGSRAA